VAFAEKANAFVPWVQGLRERLDVQGDLEQQIAEVDAITVRRWRSGRGWQPRTEASRCSWRCAQRDRF